jgi:hypothetical protein
MSIAWRSTSRRSRRRRSSGNEGRAAAGLGAAGLGPLARSAAAPVCEPPRQPRTIVRRPGVGGTRAPAATASLALVRATADRRPRRLGLLLSARLAAPAADRRADAVRAPTPRVRRRSALRRQPGAPLRDETGRSSVLVAKRDPPRMGDDLQHARAVAEQVARQLEQGYEHVAPANATFLGFTDPPAGPD